MAFAVGSSQYYPISHTGYGLEISNSLVDATNDITITAGECPNTTRALMLRLGSQITKRIDATWSVGTNAGGLDTGTVANSTWYYVHVIRRPDTGVVDALISLQSASPTMPTNYTQYQLIGAIYRTSGSVLRPFSQDGDEFLWKDPVLDVDTTTLSTTAVLYTLSIPPMAHQVQALCNAHIDHASGVIIYISSPDVTDQAPSSTVSPLLTFRMVGTSAYGTVLPPIRANTASQIRARSSGSSTTFKVATLGWIDRRWRS